MFPGQAVTVAGPLTKPLKTHSTERIFEALDRIARKYNPGSDLVERVLGDNPNVQLTPAELQASLCATSVAKAKLAEEKGIKCDVCMGDSAGEGSMLPYAGIVSSVEEAIDLMYLRGKFTGECKPKDEKPTEKVSSNLVVIVKAPIGLIEEAITRTPKELGYAGINKINPDQQIGISGNIPALDSAVNYLISKGIPERYCISVPVDSPVHSPLMKPAEEKMREVVGKIKFNPPSKPVIMMYSGKQETDPNRIKECFTSLISTPANLDRGIDAATKIGVRKFIVATVCRVFPKLLKRRKDVEVIED